MRLAASNSNVQSSYIVQRSKCFILAVTVTAHCSSPAMAAVAITAIRVAATRTLPYACSSLVLTPASR